MIGRRQIFTRRDEHSSSSMTKLLSHGAVCCSGLAIALAFFVNSAAADPAAAPTAAPMSTPAMTGPLTANPNPSSFDAGLGSIYVTGMVTALGMVQSNATHGYPDNGSSALDLSNGQISLQKTDGLVQFYVQAGEYSMPSLGAAYIKSSQLTSHTFGVVPVGYLKLQLSDTFSVEVGKLSTLIGAEYTFTTENMNIERGLLWNVEPAISRGVQVNYASGPLSMSVSLNDGYYSNKYNWISGLISYAIDSNNTLAFAGGGNVGESSTSTFATSPVLNNSQIYNLLYTYNSAPVLINPYIQYQHVDRNSTLGLASGSDWGFGVLATYTLSDRWSLSGRAEYETSSGAQNLLYGSKSSAYSFTVTPTWQNKLFFIRGDLSYTGLSSECADCGFGSNFNKDDQFRAMVETGVIF